ncbi:hypothetical protein ABK040_006458 [Willaertia magna]
MNSHRGQFNNNNNNHTVNVLMDKTTSTTPPTPNVIPNLRRIIVTNDDDDYQKLRPVEMKFIYLQNPPTCKQRFYNSERNNNSRLKRNFVQAASPKLPIAMKKK